MFVRRRRVEPPPGHSRQTVAIRSVSLAAERHDEGDDPCCNDRGGDAERERSAPGSATQTRLLRHPRRLARLGLCAPSQGFVEELALGLREPHRGRRAPLLELVEATTGEQVVGVTAGGQPFVDDQDVGSVLAQFLTSGVDPSLEVVAIR